MDSKAFIPWYWHETPEEELINHLQAELDALLQSLELINHYNSRGKTKKIADEIRTILTHYKRNK